MLKWNDITNKYYYVYDIIMLCLIIIQADEEKKFSRSIKTGFLYYVWLKWVWYLYCVGRTQKKNP